MASSFHKIDRSARNLKDWADLGELIDRGIAVHVAGEGLDLSSRSGRLAADIQAIMAADYIRNLREEAKHGIRKRLEQGLYPMRAPVGYLDQGGGKQTQSIQRKRRLSGWPSAGTRRVNTRSGDSPRSSSNSDFGTVANRESRSPACRTSFGIPSIWVMCSCELWTSFTQASMSRFVTKDRFFAVQARLKSRVWPRRLKHWFKYSRMLKFKTCGRSLVGSERKGHVYYRCQTVTCPTVCAREDRLTMLIDCGAASLGPHAANAITAGSPQ